MGEQKVEVQANEIIIIVVIVIYLIVSTSCIEERPLLLQENVEITLYKIINTHQKNVLII